MGVLRSLLLEIYITALQAAEFCAEFFLPLRDSTLALTLTSKKLKVPSCTAATWALSKANRRKTDHGNKYTERGIRQPS